MNGLLLKPPYYKPLTEYHKMFILFIARQNCICKSLKLSCLSRLSLLTRIKSFRIDSGLIHKALLFIQFDWNTKLFLDYIILIFIFHFFFSPSYTKVIQKVYVLAIPSRILVVEIHVIRIERLLLFRTKSIGNLSLKRKRWLGVDIDRLRWK